MNETYLNGKNIEAEQGRTILDVAREAGIDIPTLCYYRALSPYGACRVCLVEITDERGSRLVASCSHPVADGLKVSTDSDRVLESRKVIVELLWARCPDSEKLAGLAEQLGVTLQQYREAYG